MNNGLLILKRIVARKKQKKQFNENDKCLIAISGIRDKHLGIKPAYIECFSVPDLYGKLRIFLSRGGMPPYNFVARCVEQHGFFQIIKEEHGQIRYTA